MRIAGLDAVAGLAALIMSAPAGAQQPIKDGDTLTSTLRLVTTRHPNGSKIEAYQIVSAPRAMPADDDFCEIRQGCHHVSSVHDDGRRAEAVEAECYGKTVSVKAAALFCSHTAWHIGDVGVPEWSLVAKNCAIARTGPDRDRQMGNPRLRHLQPLSYPSEEL